MGSSKTRLFSKTRLNSKSEPYARSFAAKLLLLPSLFLIISMLLLPSASCFASSAYSITKIYDGDTVELNGINGKIKLRLSDIDAPERNQPYGKKSRRALTKLCKGKNILINAQIVGTDKYNRALGHMQCNGTDAGLYLIDHGLAWHNAKYSNNPFTRNADSAARIKRVGLWKGKKPMPPWVWRQKQLRR